jgi:hypothetical protein
VTPDLVGSCPGLRISAAGREESINYPEGGSRRALDAGSSLRWTDAAKEVIFNYIAHAVKV